MVHRAVVEPLPEPVLAKFNLDFPGGTPKELVAAIEKAAGRPLNAIVPDELAATKLPAVKMNNVDVAQLFSALSLASNKRETYLVPGFSNYQISQTLCGFKTAGTPSDDSIWYFYVERPVIPPAPPPQKICRFYSLAPYLDRGLSVDDITTAIETGWKMMGETTGGGGGGGFGGGFQAPAISFHKDTKLLIAVGEPSKLETVDAVLKALEAAKVAKETKTQDLEELDGVLKVLQKHNLSPFPPGAPPLTNPAGQPAEKPKSEK